MGLFNELPRSRQRRVLGHVIDAGNSDRGERTLAQLRCRAGHVWETHTSEPVSVLKRGLPCPFCNSDEGAA